MRDAVATLGRDRAPVPAVATGGPDRRVVWVLLGAIVLLGGALRLYRLDALSLWLDCAWSSYARFKSSARPGVGEYGPVSQRLRKQ
jgi:hypothetical protein